MKVQIEIDIPSGHEVDTVRHTNSHYDGTLVYCVTVKAAKPFLINGVPSDWPEWLLADWITKDEDGELYLHKSEPKRESDGWVCTNGIHYLDKSLVGIDIPGPWEQSLRENPRRKK